MEKFKFIVAMITTIVLFQISFLVNFNELCAILNMILIVLVWVLGTRKINKDTILKKIMIYGFVVFWFLAMLIISYFSFGKYFRSFGVMDIEWQYSVFVVFIISKILSTNVVKNKIENNTKYFVIAIILMLILGTLISYGIECLVIELEEDSILEMLIYYINICIFSGLIFSTLKIKTNNKISVAIITGCSIIVVCLVNIIPIQKISKIIAFQEEVSYEITYNSTAYTYKSLASNLAPFIEKAKTFTSSENAVWDYQQYGQVNELMYVTNLENAINYANRKNFSDTVQSLESFLGEGNTAIQSGRIGLYTRISALVLNVIVIGGATVYLLRKNSADNEI